MQGKFWRSLSAVRDTLYLTYDIFSKPSYERKLKEWGLQKNTMGTQRWEMVARTVEKRRREGKESEVYDHGIQLPPDEVRKETALHKVPRLQDKFGLIQGNTACNSLSPIDLRMTA